jgi:tetratricopeptide (TPR) repeat protein
MLIDLLRGNAEKTEQAARQALERGPRHLMFYRFLALALIDQGRFEEALPYARKMVAMDGRHMSLVYLAWTMIEGAIDIDEGIEIAKRALDVPLPPAEQAWVLPQFPSAEHCLGLGYLKLERADEAVEMLEKAAELRPDRPRILEDLKQARSLL